MRVEDLIKILKDENPEDEVRFIQLKMDEFGRLERNVIFVEDISKSENNVIEILMDN